MCDHWSQTGNCSIPFVVSVVLEVQMIREASLAVGRVTGKMHITQPTEITGSAAAKPAPKKGL
jgi:hypothetical protein